jgi:hypothetical protein
MKMGGGSSPTAMALNALSQLTLAPPHSAAHPGPHPEAVALDTDTPTFLISFSLLPCRNSFLASPCTRLTLLASNHDKLVGVDRHVCTTDVGEGARRLDKGTSWYYMSLQCGRGSAAHNMATW